MVLGEQSHSGQSGADFQVRWVPWIRPMQDAGARAEKLPKRSVGLGEPRRGVETSCRGVRC